MGGEATFHTGWHQVAFARDVEGDVGPAAIGPLALVLVRTGGGLRAFAAHCPHRGAHLGYGGRLDGDVVVCPFHGRRVGLGEDHGGEFCVRAYPTLDVDGVVFVLVDPRHENGLGGYLDALTTSHCLVPGFTLQAAVAADVVIENAVDADHFHAVHEIDARPRFEPRPSARGELAVEAVFSVPRPNPWQQEFGERESAVELRFSTRVFSPNLVATELGEPPTAPVVLTAATPAPGGGCVIRVTLGVPVGPDGAAPPRESLLVLLRDSRTAFEQDLPVWEHLAPDFPARYGPGDWAVAEYRRFCERFR